ncbi:serine/threonine-protein kinase [Hydrogenivirga caldilitoris]|uniref:Serine/threonine-protein kinase n=1 Tax=Hydrogenivirga caldilitoris TaxID=246264 RepID=A0A497XU17_9AQUI|nr:serine/threonine-protein kinase [Hydrogenivirga caldilitoris]RLJ70632.1 serine/threonine-protein kinase [Hydrogenivirga caldilitoris]
MEDLSHQFKEGDIILGYYEVLSVIGRGDFGIVYRVRGVRGRYRGKILALKVASNPYGVEYLWKEAQTLILFNHPNIISLQSYLYKKDRGELYVLYELMDVGDLKEYVLSKGGLSEKEALKVLWNITNGLAFLHSRGYIHSDIKPENVFGKKVLKSIVWKLGDFGLLKIRGSVSVLDIKGTLGYIAPEVFRGEIHRSSDIYSLGCLLYFTLFQRDPFHSEDRKEKLKRNKEGLYLPPEGVSDKVRGLLERMLERDYKKRFRTAAELKDYLVVEGLV